ncbi:LOW QUALITY PROTEIN: hypothetical protein OSB04_001931 [Centaurea solstitialis]|uniref:Reverse transcriptase domain-containing protein n=1 Tax=Centaurea solstitialis TaxID=347529 RepID=A0AA38TRY4_9ASTR|nr:LOW QUALITY PROTEIN: hypothetical protein OSB04_001931 [Centaurea solstitialis]
MNENALWSRVIISLHGFKRSHQVDPLDSKKNGTWSVIASLNNALLDFNIDLRTLFQCSQDDSWVLEDSGVFSVSYLRRALDDMISYKIGGFRTNWLKVIPSKINIFAWRLQHGRLSTLANLSSRGTGLVSDLCFFCGAASETEQHLFCSCPVTRAAVEEFRWGVPYPNVDSTSSFLHWGFYVGLKGIKLDLFSATLFTFAWAIWKLRNGKAYCSSFLEDTSLMGFVQSSSLLWINSRGNLKRRISWADWCSNPLEAISSLSNRLDFKKWRLDKNLEKHKVLADLNKKLDEFDLKAENTGCSPSESRQRQETLLRIKELERAINLDLKQRARVKWTLDGDENSSFYHGIINRNKRSNFIHGISINGSWVTDPATIKQVAFNFFASKFSPISTICPPFRSQHFKKLSLQQAESLERAISEEELKGAVWDCGSEKAPGPDGFTFAFLKHFWATIKCDLLAAVKHFEVTGSFDKGCNSSFIALIPKTRSPSLCVSLDRLACWDTIAKVLANRLKSVIHAVIGQEQMAFVKDRSILDGPLIISELISWAKKVKKQLMVFKIDFDKAFDSLSWGFLDDIMDQMNFGGNWRRWIQGCLKSAAVSVLINGSPTPEFTMGRGVRQGDPLAPFLFIIAAEALNIAMKEACERGVFKGINLPNSGPIISHLQFADDTVFMGEWSQTNMANLIRILRCFYLSSGLKINLDKSSLLGVGVDSEQVFSLANHFHCKPGKFPITYLGLPLGCSMNRVDSWEPIINKFSSKLSNWKSQYLSFGGRLVLLKSVLGSLGVFFFSLFKAPQKVINRLESIRMNFFWGKRDSCKKIAWISWNKVLASKEKGGLEVGSLKALNLALVTKWWWRFKSETDSLWKRVIQSLHGISGGLEVANPSGKNTGVWRNILKVHKDFSKVNIPIQSWFQTNDDVSNPGNHWRWVLEPTGVFSVSSLRRAYDDFYLNSNLISVFHWNSWIPAKVNILAWRTSHRRLPTKVNLANRGVPLVSLSCPFCNSFDENESHIFSECSLSNLILKKICSWWNIDAALITDHPTLFDWADVLNLKGDNYKVFTGVIYTFLWVIWKARNSKVFSDASHRLDNCLFAEIQALSFFWLMHRGRKWNALSWNSWCCDPTSMLLASVLIKFSGPCGGGDGFAEAPCPLKELDEVTCRIMSGEKEAAVWCRE